MPSIAPLVAAWQRNMRSLPGPFQAASVTDGTPFLPDELTDARLVVLVALGADPNNPSSWVFTDITTAVLQDNGRTVHITQGKPPEGNFTPPASCSLALKNLTGDWSAYNPLSVNWPYLVDNVPLWVRVWYQGQYYTRFLGLVKGWKPGFDTTGNYSITNVTAYGISRRAAANTQPAHSAIWRSVMTTTPTQLRQFWSLEDGFNAVAGASALPGAPSLKVNGTVRFSSFDPLHPSNSTFLLIPNTHFGWDSLPDFKEGGTLHTGFTPSSRTNGYTWQFTAFNDFISNGAQQAILTWLVLRPFEDGQAEHCGSGL